MKIDRNIFYLLVAGILLVACDTGKRTTGEQSTAAEAVDAEWISLFNGENLEGWTARGDAEWTVVDGVLKGYGGKGHLYADPELADLEVKGMFRLSDQGGGANSGLYFRAYPPEDNPDGFPRGYEAQICHNQEAHTGWLWSHIVWSRPRNRLAPPARPLHCSQKMMSGFPCVCGLWEATSRSG